MTERSRRALEALRDAEHALQRAALALGLDVAEGDDLTVGAAFADVEARRQLRELSGEAARLRGVAALLAEHEATKIPAAAWPPSRKATP